MELASEHPELLAYPTGDLDLAFKRAKVLVDMGIEEVILIGGKTLGKVKVLGKGKSSIVVACKTKGKILAAKIRRMDSPRSSLKREAEALISVNEIGVGPRLLSYTDDVIIMDLVPGEPLRMFLAEASNAKPDRSLGPLLSAMIKARLLDRAGIDHGELHDPREHVVVICGSLAEIIDFGSSSTQRRPANVTKLIQALFIGGPYSKVLSREWKVDGRRLMEMLRIYKRRMDEESFGATLEVLEKNITSGKRGFEKGAVV